MEPKIIRPFGDAPLAEIQAHVREIRRAFDWPGIPYHDAAVENEGDKFNRWFWHNLPLLKLYHHDLDFLKLACESFQNDVKPSYSFLSMYGKEGVCPPHTDRGQCQFTIDLVINQDGEWPLYIDDKPYIL